MKVKPKKRAWFPYIVVGLLVAHVGGMMLAVYIAIGDHTFVALPDYYGKSIRWDQIQDELRRSDALGWKRTIQIVSADKSGNLTLRMQVTDADKNPVSGLAATAVVFPELLPNQTLTVSFRDEGQGSYSASYAPTHTGPIVLDLRATRAADTFVTRATLFLGSGS